MIVRQGTFLKIPHPRVVELLRDSGLDFGVIDAEHAPFDRRDIDLALAAAGAAAWPLFVRVSENRPSEILNALDLGAAGVVVPHVENVAAAEAAVAAARYRGGRGFSSAPRSAGYGAVSPAEALVRGDDAAVIVQIEHPDGVDRAERILDVDGLAGLLVGRADLAVAMGRPSANDPEIERITLKLLNLATGRGLAAGVAVGSMDEARRYAALGATWIICSSDQGMLQRSGHQLAAAFPRQVDAGPRSDR